MTAAPKWQAGKLYLPGDLVQPVTRPPTQAPTLLDPGFESGTLDGWDVEMSQPGITTPVVTNYRPKSGAYNLMFDTGVGAALVELTVLNKAQPAVTPGTRITANGWLRLSFDGIGGGMAVLAWYDANGERIGFSEGTHFHKLSNKTETWYQSGVSGVAPAGSATVRAGWLATIERDADIRFDELSWDYTGTETTDGLLYRAVQAAAGTSGASEPNWPPVLGQQVTDNEVIWEAVSASRVTWTASPLYVSGATEPDWPTTVGSRVNDNGISWEAVSRRVEDEKCPNSKVVAIVASKVYAADDDIVRYSATVNPLDWSSPEDAGYLPYGLQQYGANPVAALGIYRSNLVAFNSQAFQMWQVDEDPANSALLDALPIGSTFHKALSPVSNDLFFLSAQGVRTVGIAGGSTNLAAGDVGMPIDPLVQEAMRVASANSSKTLATYYPGAGQYWLAFQNYPPPPLSISGDLPDGFIGESVTGAYTASGGVLPHGDITVVSGTFPPGLTLNADGTYSGSCTTEGSYSWTVQVEDAGGNVATLNDACVVTDAYVWMLSYGSFADSAEKGKFGGDEWASAGAIQTSGRVYYANGVVHVQQISGSGYSYSTDGGDSWITANLPSRVGGSSDRVVHAGGYYFVPNAVSGMWRRPENSAVWSSPSPMPEADAHDIATHNGKLFNVTTAQGPFATRVSLDCGDTWAVGGAYSAAVSLSKAFLATNGDRLIVLYSEGGTAGYASRVKVSDDDGATWSESIFSFASPSVSNTPAWLEYMGDGRWLAGTAEGMTAYSHDDGDTWTAGPTLGGTISQFSSSRRGRWMAACHGGLLYSSDDYGVTWGQRTDPAGTVNISGIAWIYP